MTKKNTKSKTIIEKQKTSKEIIIIVIISKPSIMRQKVSKTKQKKTNKHCICAMLIL